jgi:hypothetical protein
MNVMQWFVILIALLVGIVSARKGFFAVWGTIFNVLIAIYLGVMLTPLIIGTFQKEGVSCYCCAGCVGGIALLLFTVLEAIVYCCFFKDGKVILPWVLDTLGAGVLGFVCGYIVCSFLFLVIGIMPVESPFQRNFFDKDKLVAAGKGPVVKSCDFVSGMSLQFKKGVAKQVVSQIIAETKDHRYNPHLRHDPYLEGDEQYDVNEIADEEPQ